MKNFKVTLFFIFFLFNSTISYKCGVDSIKKKFHKINDTRIDNKRGLANNYTPIKFVIDYTYLISQNILSSTQLNKIKTIFNEVTQYLSSLLSISHINLIMDKKYIPEYCEISKYSTDIENLFYNNDIIIFPMINENMDEDVLAQAWTCIVTPDNRPAAGVVEINQEFSLSKLDSNYYIKYILLHELSHVLGFSSSFFKMFNYIYTENKNGVKKSFLNSPKVVKRAKLHFNCNNIKGVQLENQGGEGSAGSHWESRYMLGDYMISTDYTELVISDITLAFFEDTGFYKVNYYTGGLFRFGKNKGCTFLEEDCVKNNGKETSFTNDFCTEAETSFCGSSHLNRGDCYIIEYDEKIESQYKHFSNEYLGGFSVADYCPVSYNYYDEELESNYNYPYNCNFGAQIYKELGEIIGENSLCFESSLILESYNKNLDDIYSVCYKVECDRNKKQIILNILGLTVICPGTETVLNKPNGFNGQIKCPDYNLVCTSKTLCNELFDCIDKKSEADLDTYNNKEITLIEDEKEEESNKNSNNNNNNNNKYTYLSLNGFFIALENIILLLL